MLQQPLRAPVSTPPTLFLQARDDMSPFKRVQQHAVKASVRVNDEHYEALYREQIQHITACSADHTMTCHQQVLTYLSLVPKPGLKDSIYNWKSIVIVDSRPVYALVCFLKRTQGLILSLSLSLSLSVRIPPLCVCVSVCLCVCVSACLCVCVW